MYVVHVVQGAHVRMPHVSSTLSPVPALRPESTVKLHSAPPPKVIYVPPSPSDCQAHLWETNETILLGGNSISRPLPAMVQPRAACSSKLGLGNLATALKELMRSEHNSKHVSLTSARIRHQCRQQSHIPSPAVSFGMPLAGYRRVIQLPAGYSSPQGSRQTSRHLKNDILAGPGFACCNPAAAAAAPAHSDDAAEGLQAVEKHHHQHVISAISIHSQATATAAMTAVLVPRHDGNKHILRRGWKPSALRTSSPAGAAPASSGAIGPDVLWSPDSWLNGSTSGGASAEAPANKASHAAAAAEGPGGVGADPWSAAAAAASSTHNTSSSGKAAGKETAVIWGTPIGGTLYINPDCQPSVGAQPAAFNTACSAGPSREAATTATPLAADASSCSGGDSHGGRQAQQPLPESMPDTPDVSTTASRQVAAAMSRCNLAEGADPLQPALLMTASVGSQPVPQHAVVGGLNSMLPEAMAAPSAGARAANAAAAAKAVLDVPKASLGVLKLGVLLMGAAATVALSALYYSQRSSAGMAISPPATDLPMATAVPRCADTRQVCSAGAAVEDSGQASLPGFHEWMVRRLSSTLKQFEAEKSLLNAEMSVLQALERQQQQAAGAARAAAVADRLRVSLRGFFGNSGTPKAAGDQSTSGRPGQGMTAATPGLAGDGALAADQDLSPAGITARIRQIQEQLESLDVLKAALTTELTDQQQQQHGGQGNSRGT